MRKITLAALVFVFIFMLGRVSAQPDEYCANVRIGKLTECGAGLDCFRVTLPDATSIVVWSDSDVTLAQWMREHQNQRVSLTLK